MKADLTRLTFDPAKHYRGVHQQQGRVQLDSDWNEQVALTAHRIETETLDVVGHCGAPLHDDGFRLVSTMADLSADEAARPGNAPLNPAPPAGDLLITAGRFYAGGFLVENERLVPVSLQPELPTPAQVTASGLPAPTRPNAAGTYLAYLDVWPRHRTALEDPSLREVALGGPDTATRTKNTWQVKFLSVPAGTTCSTPLAGWDALTKPALGTLSAELVTAPATDTPCIVEPGSGYRRLENQLYRVEVHQAGATLAQTTFKWSRDNGSVTARWLDKQAGSLDLRVENTGRDKVLGLAENQWVELTDDTREELGQPGLFVEIDRVEGDIVRLKAPHLAASEIAKFPRYPKLRRWEGRPASAPGKWLGPDGNEKTLSTAAGAAGLFELEDGVAVRFGAGAFRTGDYWLIPARTAKPQLDWPLAAGTTAPAKVPPQGVPHHFCKLAIVVVPVGGGAPTITDCRSLFPPLTELTSVFYVGGDAQSATPDPTKPANTLLPLPLPLEVGVANGEHPVAGARVRFTVTSGGGSLTGLGAGGIALTGADGVARANWSLLSVDPAGNAGHRVTAELLDSSDTRVHLPVIFHATLNTAAKVSYDPKNCPGMNSVPVVTVQDALDYLCKHSGSVECCVTVGELDGRPGDFPTIKEALAELLKDPKRPSICLSLLPGEHVLEDSVDIQLNKRSFFKINGCNHAANLIVDAPLSFLGLAGVVIRDISIEIGEEGGIRFNRCQLVELTNCVIRGHTALPALITVTEVSRLFAQNNLMRALGAAIPTDANGGIRGIGADADLEKAVGATATADYKKFSADFASKYTTMSAADRKAAAAALAESLASADGLSSGELKAYQELAALLGGAKPSAKEITALVTKIRSATRKREAAAAEEREAIVASAAAPAASTPGPSEAVGGVVITAPQPAVPAPAVVLLFEDALAEATLTDNYILGEVRYLGDGTEEGGPLDAADFKNLGPLRSQDLIKVRAEKGQLRLHGNTLGRLGWGTAFADQVRALIKARKGELTAWGGVQLSGNRLLAGPHLIVGAQLSLNGNQFDNEQYENPLAYVIADRAVFVGNVTNSPDDAEIQHYTRAAAESANLLIFFDPSI